MKTVSFLFLIVLLTFNGNSHADVAVRIGLMADLSGTNASHGENCRRGYEMAAKAFAPAGKVGRRKVDFIYTDHKGDAKTAVAEFSRLVSVEKVMAISSNRAQVVMPMNPLSKRLRIPFVATVGHDEFVTTNPYAFQFWPTPKEEGGMLAKKAIELGGKRVAIIGLQDEWTLSIANGFRDEFTRLGGQVAYSAIVNLDEADFSTIISSAKVSKPDVIFVDLNHAQTGTLLNKLEEQGLKKFLIFTNNYGGTNDTLTQARRSASEGIIFDQLSLGIPKLTELYERTYPGQKPIPITVGCYAALSATLQAIKENPNIHDTETLYTALNQMKSVKLLDEELPVLDRLACFKLTYKTVHEGRVVDYP